MGSIMGSQKITGSDFGSNISAISPKEFQESYAITLFLLS